MLFNSWEYLFFLPVVFVIYWALSKKKVLYQNIFLLFASYTFYGFWDVRFLFLILASSLVDFYIGHKIYDNIQKPHKKKNWVTVSVVFNLGLLGTFKYFNFFVDSFIDLTQSIGIENSTYTTLNIILPVGISFYTFQTLSYSLDIYYQKLRPTKDLIAFTAFVSFFPQLVAGPIERASNLLSQIGNERNFNYIQVTDGLKLILWGLFKKIVIADSLAPIVDDIFLNYNNYSASTLVLGIVFFSFQVYGDFSGYSDIAIGSSKLFGIELRSNFKFPHFSRNVAEYWQRWHISLSTWFRHYMYIPMGGSRVSKLLSIRNIIIIFLVSGFWHGANWTFIIWGGLHALFYIPVFLTGRNRIYANNSIGEKSGIPTIIEVLQVLLTFALVSFSRIFFRSPTVTDAFDYLKRIMTEVSFENYLHPKGYRMIDFFILIITFTLYEYLIRKDERRPFNFKNKGARTMIYSLMILAMILFYDNTGRSFIYFQF